MKVVILAGGLGTRLAEETEVKPKPLIEIGGRPILWHIMKHYAHYGFTEFFIALGYKGEAIKRFFTEYSTLDGNMIIEPAAGKIQTSDKTCENWKIHLLDTGAETMTGGRLKRLTTWLKDETFMLTYGDGVCDVDLKALLAFHLAKGRTATVTAVRPPARFGGLVLKDDLVTEFTEKAQIQVGWINGGFMVFEPEIFKYLADDHASLEHHALEVLAAKEQLTAYRHEGFWQCMDTLRDKRQLEGLWQSGQAPWRVWA